MTPEPRTPQSLAIDLIDRAALRKSLQASYDNPGFAASPDYYGGLGLAIDELAAAPAAEPVPLTLDDIIEWLRRSDGRLEDIFGLWTQGKRDDRWVAEKLLAEGHLAALTSPDKGEPR